MVLWCVGYFRASPVRGSRGLTPSPAPPPPRSSERLRITFVNHSTFLLQLDGINILTDPIWSERASPVSWAGPRRRRAPGVRLEDLPPIDLVLLSHDHYDHLDIPTLRQLAQDHHPTIYTGLKNSRAVGAARNSQRRRTGLVGRSRGAQ